ncbi:type IV pilus modification protein PilV [Rhodanobacter sp. L36]|uniref:type IV pilus modification protein PilV n=1 Tax=Rhodanobacter sp. L36 TaxID=1747221 RepID=UPI00131ACE41|nr:type IV pilus modification protein PilV [Rhodanobacter sp. L36]
MGCMSRQRGISLIEVLVATLIFSIGLIGLAGLMVMATRSNHGAYLRTQVIFLANNMANRMSANSVGVWSGKYNSSGYPLAVASVDCSTTACNATSLAARDQQMWSSQLRAFLPNPQATITCGGTTSAGYNPTAQINFRPPYGGNCNMQIQWSERSAGDQASQSNAAAQIQTFTWEFQP